MLNMLKAYRKICYSVPESSGVARGGARGWAAAPGATFRGSQIDITKQTKNDYRPIDNFGKIICKCM